jgi:hypothetical protein
MHSDWFDGIDILQGRWQHGKKVGYCYPSGLEKTLCKWEVYVPLVTKGLMYELKKKKKIGKVFTSKFVGIGPSSYEKRIYWATVSQRLRDTVLQDCCNISEVPR